MKELPVAGWSISHTLRIVQEGCYRTISGYFVQRKYDPSLPDLNSIDFGTWSILEQEACTISKLSLNALKQKLTKCWKGIDAEAVHVTCDQAVLRLRRVIKTKAGYVE